MSRKLSPPPAAKSPSRTTNPQPPDPFYALLVLQYGNQIAELCADADRQGRMRTVLGDLALDVRLQAESPGDPKLRLDNKLLRKLAPPKGLPRLAVLCSLTQTQPFGSYSLRHDQGLSYEGLRRVATELEVPAKDTDRIIDAWRDVDAHITAPTVMGMAIGAVGVAGFVTLVAVTGGLALGGLPAGGAAAFTSALATFGAGSMAGGLLFVGLTGSATALVSTHALRELAQRVPPEVLQAEIRKSLITLTIAAFPDEMVEATRANLAIIQEETQKRRDHAADRNDPGSQPMKRLDRLLTAVDRAEEWIDTSGHFGGRARTKQAGTDSADWARTAAEDARRTAKTAFAKVFGD